MTTKSKTVASSMCIRSFTIVFQWIILIEFCRCADKTFCQSNLHVCTSLMKYPDEQVFDEGPYCACEGCSNNWEDGDGKSLTWRHYGRADKSVQYRFCHPVLSLRMCKERELAVTMQTETGAWSPHIREPRCACPGNQYELLGWRRQNLSNGDNTTGLWIYEYFCDKDECESGESLCAKIYVDNDERQTIGYLFQCSCPRGYKCPDDRDMEHSEEETLEMDQRGNEEAASRR